MLNVHLIGERSLQVNLQGYQTLAVREDINNFTFKVTLP